MTFCLNTTIVKPEEGEEIKNAVILLHGYGGDGKDISMLTLNWKRFLKNTVFLCPDGHETCPINPVGFQWFDLSKDDENYVLNEAHKAENIIRINGDCPLISPKTIECIVNLFNENLSYDYLSTTLDESFPVGEHIEVISSEAFLRASEDILTSSTKEHVTPIFYKSITPIIKHSAQTLIIICNCPELRNLFTFFLTITGTNVHLDILICF